MANIKELSRKTASLRNMQKVTRAMNMIATVKLRKLYSLQDPINHFAAAVESIAADMAGCLAHLAHPVIKGYRTTTREHVILFTADRGLCGAHNNSVQRELAAFMAELGKRNCTADVTALGLKGASFCHRKGYELHHHSEISDRVFGLEQLRTLADQIFGRFVAGEVQNVTMIYNRFVSTLQQVTVRKQLLPVRIADDEREKRGGSAVTEPGAAAFAAAAGQRFLYYSLCAALYSSYLSEFASRMTAMENATRNSEDLIDRYVALQNRARQTAITNEIIEVVSGKEALEG
jgi:F-type H+-transporting ATPase subunit gamma